MNNEVNVCLSVNEKWAPFVAVTIASIMSNTNATVKFFVLHTGLELKIIEKISALTTKFNNMKIEYIEVNTKLLTEFKCEITYISVDTFSKFLFADLRKNINKVIYTDVDVAFNGDIQELFNSELDDYIIGAVPGISHINGKDNERLNVHQSHQYFQAGLLLIDCNKWRDQKILSQLRDLAKSRHDLRYGDQDLLNIKFATQYKPLDQKYCVIPWQLKEMYDFSDESQKALEKPFIIHYCGGDKPWIRKTELDEYFWKYVEITEFNREIQCMFLKNNFISMDSDISIQQYHLFKYIPLIKIKRKVCYDEIVDRYFLFNFIQILKKVKKPNMTIWSTFYGIHILNLKKLNAKSKKSNQY